MEAKGGYDILCPFGNGKMMLVDGTLSAGEREETDEETEGYVAPTTSSPGTTVANLSSTITNPLDVLQDNTQTGLSHPAARSEDNVEDLEPDFDDVVGLTEESSFENVNIRGVPRPKYNPWIFIDGKKVHKATILRLYLNPLAVSDSKDRLKRVRGFSQYDESAREASLSFVAPNSKMDDDIQVQDRKSVV